MPASPSPADTVYERVQSICLGFPGAEVKLSHGSPAFHVRGKMFLTFVDDHHGDGRLGVWCKSTFDEQKRLVADDPGRFFVPPYVGVAGWVGVRLDHPKTDWIELAILVEGGWASVAPKRVAEGAAPRPPAKPLRRPKTDPKRAAGALERLSAICLALPEAEQERQASHASFTVRKKTFVYFLDNHHGDEIIGACLRAPKGQNASLARKDPRRFYVPQYLGSKGWLGVRLDVARVDWEDVAERVAYSYKSVAPKRLAERVEG
jgi:hypothetical protein